MLLKAGGKILRGKDGFLSVTPDGDLILKFTVQGTCFPAKRTIGNPASYEFTSNLNINNKVFIDYNDGTGEHEYNFKSSGSNRRIYFRNLANGTTPETIQGSGVYDEIVHFYQDLPPEIVGTVVDSYPQKREVVIRFEKPQDIINITIDRILVFGSISSSISRYRNLDTLYFRDFYNIESFAQDFYNSSIKNLTFSNIGRVMDSGIPLWIVNSNRLQMINLSGSVDLSGDPVSKNLDKINNLKDSLTSLNLSSAKINYKIPETFTELYKLSNLDLGGNPIGVQMPDNLTDLTALKVLSFNNARFPFADVERVIEELPVLETLDISASNYTSAYDISDDNYNVITIIIGGQSWGAGNPPPFINKLKALKSLQLYRPGSGLLTELIGWGDFSEIVTLEDLRLPRNTNLTTEIPIWFGSLVNLKSMLISASFQNTGGINSFVNNFYELVVANASMSIGNTKFRQMIIDAYGTSTLDQANSTRPSGTYQQPAGYVQGSSNGTPTSPMEKIWVLTNQYNHSWTVKPA
jgi:hypothetical protein